MKKSLSVLIILTLTLMWFLVFTWGPSQQLNTYYKSQNNQNQLSPMGFNVKLGLADKATATVQRPFINRLKILPIKDKLFYTTMCILFITILFKKPKEEENAIKWQKGWN